MTVVLAITFFVAAAAGAFAYLVSQASVATRRRAGPVSAVRDYRYSLDRYLNDGAKYTTAEESTRYYAMHRSRVIRIATNSNVRGVRALQRTARLERSTVSSLTAVDSEGALEREVIRGRVQYISQRLQHWENWLGAFLCIGLFSILVAVVTWVLALSSLGDVDRTVCAWIGAILAVTSVGATSACIICFEWDPDARATSIMWAIVTFVAVGFGGSAIGYIGYLSWPDGAGRWGPPLIIWIGLVSRKVVSPVNL